jgi:hypothetical protein
MGGGAVSIVELMDNGRAPTACRDPVLTKSRCLCEACRLVKISEYSSEFSNPENELQLINDKDEAYRFCCVKELIIQVKSLLV